MNLAELASLLPDQVSSCAWENAYLTCAGMNQIAEDYLHRDPMMLGAIGRELGVDTQRGRLIAHGVDSAAAVLQEVRVNGPSSRGSVRWQRSVAALLNELAGIVAETVLPEPPYLNRLTASAEGVAAGADVLPLELCEEVVRLPSCFQTFDLEPRDVGELAARFSRTWPTRSRPLLVAGVRTSGSYMAPLCAAHLAAAGYGDVRVLTLRPEHQLFARERAAVREVARRDGLALIVDDPPGSGRTVAKVADRLRRLSLPERSIVLLLPLFGTPEALPEELRAYASTLLPSDEWAIHAKLEPEAVRATLGRLWKDERRARSVRALPLPERQWQRSHERALFAVESASGEERVLVEGVGVGHYGNHALAVAEALAGHLPAVYGVDRGCLFREWLPDERRAYAGAPHVGEPLIAAVANYVVDRRRALPAKRDASSGMNGQRPVWEVASQILSRAFGRAAPAARLLLVDALARDLLAVDRPSVVDGWTYPSNWFVGGDDRTAFLKTGFAEHSFWHLGLYCYDALFDLAGAAVGAGDRETAEKLRAAYERLTREPVSDERWLLYELAQLWGRERVGAVGVAELERSCARVLQSYISRVFFDGLEPSADGPLCAIDLDGVLETQALGFPGTTAGGANALRALIAHGFRPVLVSGRSSEEVADRCWAYRLAGGVAEYGAVVHTSDSPREHILVAPEELALLERVKRALEGLAGVHVDPAYRHTVRAFRIDAAGRRTALEPGDVRAACAVLPDAGRVSVVPGAAQTDFTVAGIDKGRGVAELASRLSNDSGHLALAVGDTEADLSMLRLADLAFAPANAQPSLRRSDVGVQVLRAPYQAGLALAVARLIGHAPGGCARCRPPSLSPHAELVLSILSAQERGRLGIARRFLALQASTRAPRKSRRP